MDQARVKALAKHIKQLKVEKAGYTDEIKRLTKEIESYELLRDEAIEETAKQTPLALAEESDRR